ncbi:MAG: hypothetical protein HC806_09020 [Anaerolineae bacterium]|nr:hypothetical protein [Anaerolineae bacterium]
MEYAPAARKITASLFAAQSLASAALIATGTVNTIVGAELSGNPAWAGVPSAVLQFGAALAALAVGVTMDRIGRRWGLGLGFIVGIFGGCLVWDWDCNRKFMGVFRRVGADRCCTGSNADGAFCGG